MDALTYILKFNLTVVIVPTSINNKDAIKYALLIKLN